MAEAVDRHTYKCIRLRHGIYCERRRYPYVWMDNFGRTTYYRYYGHHFPADSWNYFSWKEISKNRKQWMRKRFYLAHCVLRNGKDLIEIRK